MVVDVVVVLSTDLSFNLKVLLITVVTLLSPYQGQISLQIYK